MKELTTEQLQHLKLMAIDAAKIFGGEWDSALVGDPAGNYHAITSEKTRDVVARASDDSHESSWLCDYLEAASPNAVVGIVDALLRQRGQTTECDHDWQTLHYDRTGSIEGCPKCKTYRHGRGNY